MDQSSNSSGSGGCGGSGGENCRCSGGGGSGYGDGNNGVGGGGGGCVLAGSGAELPLAKVPFTDRQPQQTLLVTFSTICDSPPMTSTTCTARRGDIKPCVVRDSERDVDKNSSNSEVAPGTTFATAEEDLPEVDVDAEQIPSATAAGDDLDVSSAIGGSTFESDALTAVVGAGATTGCRDGHVRGSCGWCGGTRQPSESRCVIGSGVGNISDGSGYAADGCAGRGAPDGQPPAPSAAVAGVSTGDSGSTSGSSGGQGSCGGPQRPVRSAAGGTGAASGGGGAGTTLPLASGLEGLAHLVQSEGLDTRTHVVVELYDTEASYVDSLQTIVIKYLDPLKSPENAGLLDLTLVDAIFYHIPSMLSHHQLFLDELKKRLDQWDVKQKIGDIFLDMLSKPAMIETYTNYVNNWKRARDIVKSTQQSKPAFARFLEAMAREHKGKLALDSLLIKPIQKFPKYELLLQRLIKHTDINHPDHGLLLTVQRELHDQLLKINCTEREALELDQLREIEGLIEGLIELATTDRQYIRHDLVSMSAGGGARKERALFLFSDLLLVTSIKRRSGTIRNRPPATATGGAGPTLTGSQNLGSLGGVGGMSGGMSAGISGPAGVSAHGLDANKYKLLMRIALGDLDIVRSRDENVRQALLEIEGLSEDIGTLNQINELVWQLHYPHTQLDDAVKEMLAQLNKQLAEQQNSDAVQLACLDLNLNTQHGTENVSILFSKPEKMASWEESFNEAKHKLATSGDRRPCPELVATVPIRKTRAGLQFTCAAPTINATAASAASGVIPPMSMPPSSSVPNPHAEALAALGRDVWVCNSDGYVGQVCVLSLHPEPTVTSCNGVCNARILCVTAVPGSSSTSTSSSTSESTVSPPVAIATTQQQRSTDSGESDDPTAARALLDSGSSSDEEDTHSTSAPRMGPLSDPSVTDESVSSGNAVTNADSNSTTGQSIAFGGGSGRLQQQHVFAKSSETVSTVGASSATLDTTSGVTGSMISGGSMGGSGDDPSCGEATGQNQSTMWLGTEDGCIHVYNANDNIRTKKNKLRLQHGAPILCIIYLDNRVFVSLANGDIAIYDRDTQGGWNVQAPHIISVGTATAPVAKMMPNNGKLWCACGGAVRVLDTKSLQTDASFTVNSDATKPVSALVLAGCGVWLSLQNTALLRCYHAQTHDFLCEVNVAPAVTKMLISCDDIIRQHKAACLRVTALLACRDLLWIGTSAGVLLTMPLPHITATTTRLASGPPTVVGVPHGHTGHVRFLAQINGPAPVSSTTLSHAARSMSEQPQYQHRSTSQTRAGVGSGSNIKSSSGSCKATGGANKFNALSAGGGVRPASSSVAATSATAAAAAAATASGGAKQLVISGGDGYEDFRSTNISEVAGREDSTNHLLLWHI